MHNLMKQPVGALIVAFSAWSFAGVPGVAASSSSEMIATNWRTFFNGMTPASKKVALLQNGAAFASIIAAQSRSSLAKSTTAKVLSVHMNSSSSATVRYTIELGGKAALTNQTGIAVYQSKTWKVGDSSFCALLALEGTKSPNCPKT